MYRYEPQFDSASVDDIARRRNLISSDETFRDGLERVASAISSCDRALDPGKDLSFHHNFRDALLAGRIAVSSQLMSGAGRDNNVAACTVLPSVGCTDQDRLRRTIGEMTVASRSGMGCGIDLSEYDDPAAALVALNASALRLHRELIAAGARPPALMVTCAAGHKRAAEFAAAKVGADLSNWVANISLRFSASPSEWDRLLPIIARGAHLNGEPGVLFQQVADDDNPTPDLALTSTAPCAEVFLAPGERCVFLSVNLAAHVNGGAMDWGLFKRSVLLSVRAADGALELATINAPDVVGMRRRVGVGVCGYHSALIALGVPYGLSAPVAQEIAERLTFTAHAASSQLAAERGPFPSWRSSRWQNPEWVQRKASLRTGYVGRAEWARLDATIVQNGMRNAAVVAYPPTGVLAEILGVSRSYEPHFSLAGRTGVASRFDVRVVPEVRAALGCDSGGIQIDQILDVSAGNQIAGLPSHHLLACARQLDSDSHLAVHAAFSLLADESGSKTINLPAESTVADIECLLIKARHLGLKGLTVFRDGCLDETGAVL